MGYGDCTYDEKDLSSTDSYSQIARKATVSLPSHDLLVKILLKQDNAGPAKVKEYWPDNQRPASAARPPQPAFQYNYPPSYTTPSLVPSFSNANSLSAPASSVTPSVSASSAGNLAPPVEAPIVEWLCYANSRKGPLDANDYISLKSAMVAADIPTVRDLLNIGRGDLVASVGIVAGTERRIISWLIEDYGWTPPLV